MVQSFFVVDASESATPPLTAPTMRPTTPTAPAAIATVFCVLHELPPRALLAKANVTLDQALARLKPSLRKMMDVLKDLGPDEAEVEFGLKIGGETGVVIAKGTAEVNFVIRMSWKSA